MQLSKFAPTNQKNHRLENDYGTVAVKQREQCKLHKKYNWWQVLAIQTMEKHKLTTKWNGRNSIHQLPESFTCSDRFVYSRVKTA